MTATVDPLGRRTTNVYDVMDRRVLTQDALGHRTTLGYWPTGAVRVVIDAGGGRTTLQYTARGEDGVVTDPLGRKTTQTYDGAGQRTVRLDARGLATSFTYDAAGRETVRLYADGARVTQAFDAGGRLTTVTDATGATTTVYDAGGRQVGVTVPGGLVTSFEYDASGNRTVMVDPDGGRFTSVFDALDRVQAVQDPDGQRTTYAFDAAGRRTTLTDAAGVTRAYQYDAAGRLTTQVDADAGMTPIVSIADRYDAAGNRTGRTQDGVATTWTYDAANRLTGQQRSGEAATFVYDAMGNVLVKWHEGAAPVTMAYDAANQVTTAQQGAAVTTFTHDAAGNLTVENAGGALTTHTWDGENRLTAVAFPDGTASTYTYAPDGLRRSAQEAGGASTTFVWDGEDYLQERTAGGVVRYLTVGGEVTAQTRGGERWVYVPDPLGSTVALVNAAGAVSDAFRYWPYGEEAARTGTTPTPFRYVGTQGYYRDRLASIYVRKRHYRPDLARWLSADPLALARSLGRPEAGVAAWVPVVVPLVPHGPLQGDASQYVYAVASPASQVDPSGLEVFICQVGPGGILHTFISTNLCGAVGFYWGANILIAGECRRNDELLRETSPPLYTKRCWVSPKTGQVKCSRGELIRIPGRPASGNAHCTSKHATPEQERRLCECMRRSCTAPPWYFPGAYCCINWADDMLTCAGILWPKPLFPGAIPCRAGG